MRKPFKLSAIALLTTALTAVPAYALSLNLGGNGPLVDLGNSNNADATVSVDTGNILGGGNNGDAGANAAVDINLGSIGGDGDGGLLGSNSLIDLGGDDNVDAVIDLDLGTDGDLLDLGGDGGLIDLADLGGTGDLLDLGDGPLLDLSGNDSVDAVIDLDLGTDGDLLDLGGGGSLLDLADIGGAGSLLDLGDGPLLDLSGNDEVDAAIEVDLGDGDLLYLGTTGSILDLGEGRADLVALNLLGTNVDADLNLNGGSEPVVDVNIGTGGSGVAGTGLLPDTDVEATVGGGNVASVSVTSGGDDPAGGGNGNGGGGNGNGGGGNGAGGNGGGTAGGGTGSGGSGSGDSTASNGGGSGGLVPAANPAACLTLNAAQLNELIQRHTYNRATFSSWASARSLKIVPVEFCDRAVDNVAAAADGSANVARLKAFLAAQAKVRAGLQSKGYGTDDVIAADHNGEVLIVYVI